MSDICVEAFLVYPVHEAINIKTVISAITAAFNKIITKIQELVSKLIKPNTANVDAKKQKRIKEIYAEKQVNVYTNLSPIFNTPEVIMSACNELADLIDEYLKLDPKTVTVETANTAAKATVRIVKQYFGVTLEIYPNKYTDGALSFGKDEDNPDDVIRKACFGGQYKWKNESVSISKMSQYNGFKYDLSNMTTILKIDTHTRTINDGLSNLRDRVTSALNNYKSSETYGQGNQIIRNLYDIINTAQRIICTVAVTIYGNYWTTLLMALFSAENVIKSVEKEFSDNSNTEGGTDHV